MEQRSHPSPAAIRSDDSTGPPATAPAGAPPLKKDRHIVTWNPQEDDLLRDQVAIHGTDNWTSIATQFKDKTGRQCRRRWYTYLNSECKKGGWSTEEDMLLCEAQKIFGNRWTEIAKVVSGRTDNAVKNRFSTLCKKRAKHEASTKENSGPFDNQQNKRVTTHMPSTHVRYEVSNLTENRSKDERLLRQRVTQDEQSRPPLAMLVQNLNSLDSLPTQFPLNNNTNAIVHDDLSNQIQGAFFKRDDPKLAALLQQANLLSSLAAKVKTDSTAQSLEDAWKELHDYLIQTEGTGSLGRKLSEMDFVMNDFKDLIDDLKSTNIESQLTPRESDSHEESQGSSEYSTGSTHCLYTQGSRNAQQAEECLVNYNVEIRGINENAMCPSNNSGQGTQGSGNVQQQADESLSENMLHQSVDAEAVLPSCGGPNGNESTYTVSNSEFSSPLQTTPVFTKIIPSPEFSASERQFLLSLFGLSSPLSNPSSIKEPSCKRALIHSLSPP